MIKYGIVLNSGRLLKEESGEIILFNTYNQAESLFDGENDLEIKTIDWRDDILFELAITMDASWFISEYYDSSHLISDLLDLIPTDKLVNYITNLLEKDFSEDEIIRLVKEWSVAI